MLAPRQPSGATTVALLSSCRSVLAAWAAQGGGGASLGVASLLLLGARRGGLPATGGASQVSTFAPACGSDSSGTNSASSNAAGAVGSPVLAACPAAAATVGSTALALLREPLHQLQQRRDCRWLAEARHDFKASPGASITLTPSGILPGMHPHDTRETPEKAIEVRMESQVIWDSCWRRFEERYRLQDVRVPREVVWLNGAPGSGKGINTMHILKTRGLETSMSISQLLMTHPEAKAIVDRGDMIPDTWVGDILLESLLSRSCAATECGVLVDGFPRTAVQVDFLKLLYDKLMELHGIWAGTPHEPQFPRPLFKVVMLYVDEETSIKRQMERAKAAHLHNQRVMDAGAGELWEQRVTDMSIDKCKKRYQIFKTHYGATMRLKQFFPFHLIDSMGTLEETQEAISLELRYQSSLDLSADTYASIRHLPLSRDLAHHARQQLVSRLDDHAQKHPHLFQKVIDVITAEIMPVLRESGMAGRVEYVCDAHAGRVFNDHPRAAQMLIDILTDRGYSASHSTEITHVPIRIDMHTGLISNRKDTKHKFNIHWETKGVREMAKAIEIATRMAESAVGGRSNHISQSFIPGGEGAGLAPPVSASASQRLSAAIAAASGPGAHSPSVARSLPPGSSPSSSSASSSAAMASAAVTSAALSAGAAAAAYGSMAEAMRSLSPGTSLSGATAKAVAAMGGAGMSTSAAPLPISQQQQACRGGSACEGEGEGTHHHHHHHHRCSDGGVVAAGTPASQQQVVYG